MSSFLLDILSSDAFNNFHTQTGTSFAWGVWKQEFLHISNKHASIYKYKVKARCNPWISRQHLSEIYKRAIYIARP